MADITYLHPWTQLPVPVARVLDGAKTCTAVLVLGETADGDLYAAASVADVRALLHWVEQWKFKVLSGEYG